jgi:hypothetical protein
MSFVSECPSCGQKLKVPDNLVGKKVRCSKCASTFVAESVTAKPPAAAPPPAPARPPRDDEREEQYDDRRRDDVEDEERPRRRSRRGDDVGGAAPGRGGMLMTFGIISIASPILALVLSFVAGLVFPPLGFCGWVIVLVGLVLGIMAWVMGSGDLKKIRAGQIDAAAQGQTKSGYITGIVGTILNILYVVCGCIAVIVMITMGVAILGAGAAASQQKNSPFNPAPKRSFQMPLPKLSQYLPERIVVAPG